jgi:hypothetical protein
MLRQTIIAAALAATSLAASAADYYLVAPVKGKTVNASAISVSLAQAAIPGAEVGVAYTYDFKPNLQVTGDTAYTGFGVKWSLSAGALPAGLSLNAETGVIAGAPSEDGMFSFTVQASYKTKAGTNAYQVSVATIAVGLADATLTAGKVGVPYNYSFTPLLSVTNDSSYAGNGVTWAVSAGTIPAGLRLDSAGGTLTGTPTAFGDANFTIRATYRNKPASHAYALSILPAGDISQVGLYRAWADGTFADSCKSYRFPTGKSYSGDVGDGVYRIQFAGEVHDVYCDMTTDSGGWTMWYSTSGVYHLATGSDTPIGYGTHGYSRNLRKLPFREILYVQHSTGNKDWFTRDTAVNIRVADYIGTGNVLSVAGNITGTWTGKGGADARYKYELTMGDYTWMQVGLMMSGHTDTCWKAPGSWCSDTSTNFYRISGEGNGVNDTASYGGVAFHQNGHRNVAAQLMSVGVR